MAISRSGSSADRPRRRRATTPENRQNQLAAAAYDLAEQQIREGTASAQVITHFLKGGSPREKLELERLRNENELLKAKVQSLQSMANVEKLYQDALNAMSEYKGDPHPDALED